MRHKFTQEEDERLKTLVSEYGIKAWSLIAELMGTLSARQCRERYCNYLQPYLTNKEWTHEEEELLSSKVLEYGQKWTKICVFFKGRSDVNVKNHWALMQRHANKLEESNKIQEKSSSLEKPKISEASLDGDCFSTLVNEDYLLHDEEELYNYTY